MIEIEIHPNPLSSHPRLEMNLGGTHTGVPF